ncbi:MAG: hypothetical protein ACRDD2_02070 [Sarcina sp.]
MILDFYERYKVLNKEISEFIEELINNNLNYEKKEDTLKILLNFNDELGNLKEGLEKINCEDKDNLNDLNYLIMDLLFLIMDLINFYNYNQVERFKMRATNYLNKQRRKEFFS